METPFYGSRKMTHWLRLQGYQVSRKRVQRLMRQLGLEAILKWTQMARQFYQQNKL
jgi:putative transposase